MAIIHVTREISAPQDKVWGIISNLDKEPTYWHGMKSIRNVGRKGANIIEREVIILYRNSKCKEIVMLNPQHSIEVKIIEGPLHGTKTIKLYSRGQDKTTIDITWNVKLVGLLQVFTLIVKRYMARQTQKALKRIAKVVEADNFAS
ncbi:MAG TPA: SRPBCC family protein [Nitrososphaera sp.]|nr:SRPBCC family protein [Nitrososphaera sp.]